MTFFWHSLLSSGLLFSALSQTSEIQPASNLFQASLLHRVVSEFIFHFEHNYCLRYRLEIKNCLNACAGEIVVYMYGLCCVKRFRTFFGPLIYSINMLVAQC